MILRIPFTLQSCFQMHRLSIIKYQLTIIQILVSIIYAFFKKKLIWWYLFGYTFDVNCMWIIIFKPIKFYNSYIEASPK